MLFDLRGRGRKNTIKVIYIMLAFLMGGGLVLFGIGGEVSGGLVDAITEGGGGGDSNEDRFEKREKDALARIQRNPQDTGAYAELVRTRVQLAGTGDRFNPEDRTYTADGKAMLRKAAESWNKYLALEPKDAEEKSGVASQMVRAFVSLEDLTEAVRAQEVVAETRESSGAYSSLAILAYEAGQMRKGDLAADKALELTDKDRRETLKGQFESAKQQALQNQVTPPSSSG